MAMGKTSARRVVALERRQQILELKRQGENNAAIARVLGLSRMAVKKHVDSAMAALTAANQETVARLREQRALDAERLEALFHANYVLTQPLPMIGAERQAVSDPDRPIAMVMPPPEQVAKHTLVCIRLLERRAKLLGLDLGVAEPVSPPTAPSEVSSTGGSKVITVRVTEELARRMLEAEDRMSEAESMRSNGG